MGLEPGVYPREEPRSAGSKAEAVVYNALKSRLPAGWYAWHSLRIMEDDGIFGEGDFLIANPERGMLALEVKGGNISQKDGRWFQNGVPMVPDPRTQANQFVHKLIRRLERDNCAPPSYGVGTCFPDVPFDTPPGQDDLTHTTIGAQDLPWLGEKLKALMEQPRYGISFRAPGPRWGVAIQATGKRGNSMPKCVCAIRTLHTFAVWPAV